MLTIAMVMAACGNGGDEGNGGGEGDKGKAVTSLSIVTGGTGGTYYPLGGAMASIIEDETELKASAQSSGASVENMNTLKGGDAEIAFTQTDIATYALNGELMFDGNKVENVQAIGTLYPETVQIITTKDSGIESVEDLKGKTVSIGALGSGVNANALQILEIHGLSVDDIEARNVDFKESTDGLQAGNIDAAFITAGTPTGSVEALAATEDVKVIPVSADKAKELIEKYPYYAEETVPSGTYGIEEDVATVAVKAMLVVREDLDEDTVYNITKAIFENTDKITHAKGELIKAETALDGIGDITVHPGADKYFTEKGVK